MYFMPFFRAGLSALDTSSSFSIPLNHMGALNRAGRQANPREGVLKSYTSVGMHERALYRGIGVEKPFFEESVYYVILIIQWEDFCLLTAF